MAVHLAWSRTIKRVSKVHGGCYEGISGKFWMNDVEPVEEYFISVG